MVMHNNKELLSYWNTVRRGRQAPKRTEITPSAISPMLPSTFILELREDNQLYFRLAGSWMCETFGREFRGLNFLERWPQTEQAVLKRHITQLLNEGTILTLNFKAQSENDHIAGFELLLLPLTHSGTAIDRILGSITPIEDYPWLGLTKLQFEQITEIHVSFLRNDEGEGTKTQLNDGVTFLKHKRLVKAKNCHLRVFDGGKTL